MSIITVCGSAKNRELIHSLCKRLQEKGFIVLTPPLHEIGKYDGLDDEGSLLIWKGVTYAHLNRIKTAGVCLMVNPGGYLGVGSTLELGYATSLGKLIIAMQHDEELTRESLFDKVLETDSPDEAASKVCGLLRNM